MYKFNQLLRTIRENVDILLGTNWINQVLTLEAHGITWWETI